MKDLLVVFLYVLSSAAADHDVHLVPAHIICPGVTKAHDILIPDPHDCSIYYKCKRGLAIPQTCPSGLLWCQILRECVLPALANCTIGHKIVTYSPDELATYHPITQKPVETNETSESTVSTQPASTPAPSPVDDICPIPGAKIPDELDCLKYYVCENNEPVSYQCGNNLEYSCWDQDCVPPQDATCINSGNQTGKSCNIDELKLLNINSCESYFECDNGTVKQIPCPPNMEFNKNFKECLKKDLAHCKSTASTETSVPPIDTTTGTSGKHTDSTGPTVPTQPASTPAPSPVDDICPIPGAKIPDELNCLKYYVCENNKPVSYQCGHNLEYSCWDQDCVPPQDATCINSGNQTGKSCSIDELKLLNMNNCESYFECVNGTVTQKPCPPNLEFNKYYKKCYKKDLAHCKLNASTETSVTPNDMTTGTSDTHTNSIGPTVPTQPASTPAPSPVDDICPIPGAKIPDEMNCLKYYVCENNKPVSYQCGHNLEYSCWDQECVPPQDATCINSGNQTGKSCSIDELKLLNMNNCESYFECVNGTVTQKPCPPNLEFNKYYKKCYKKDLAHCKLNASTETSVTPNDMTTGTSDTHTNSIGPTVPTQPASTPAPSPVDDICPIPGAKIPDEMNCLKYYVCENNKPVSYQCGHNLEYSCWDQDCVPPQDATCINSGNQTGKSCSIDELKLLNMNNCESYFECVNGTVTQKPCPPNLEFNKYYKKCYKKDLAHCKINASTETSVTPNDMTTGTSDTHTNSTGPTVPTQPASSPAPGQTNEISSTTTDTSVNSKDTTTGTSGSETTVKSGTHTSSSGQTVSTQPASSPAPGQTNEISSTTTDTSVNSKDTTTGTSGSETTVKSGTHTSSSGQTVSTQPASSPAPGQTNEISSTTADTSVNSKDTTTGTSGSETTVKSGTHTSSSGQTVSTQPASSPAPGQTNEISSTTTDTSVNPNDTTTGTSGSETTVKSGTHTSSSGQTVSTQPASSPAPGQTNEISSTTTDTSVNPNDTTTGTSGSETTVKSGTHTSSSGQTVSTQPASSPAPGQTNEISSTTTDTSVNPNDTTTGKSGSETTVKSGTDTGSTGPTVPTQPASTPAPSPVDDICPIPGAKIPDELDCLKYYVCENNEPVSYQCGNNLEYSCWDQDCVPPQDATCINSGNQTGKSCNIDELKLLNINSCESYFECDNGTVKQIPCPPNMEFNKNFKECLKKDLAHCKSTTSTTPGQTNETSSTTTETSVNPNDTTTGTSGSETTVKSDTHTEPTIPTQPASTPAPSPVDDICPIPGAKIPDELNCLKYYVCENNKPVSYQCGNNLEYSCWDQDCVPPQDATCINSGNQTGKSCSIDKLKLLNTNDCESYFECDNGTVKQKSCDPNLEFNKNFKECLKKDLAHCKSTASTTPGQTIETSSSTNLTTAGPSGSHTNSTTLPITPGPDNICPSDGVTLPNEENCLSYYVCKQGIPVLQTCPDNLEYSCWDQECLPPDSATCINQGGQVGHLCSTEGEKMPNIANCESYYKCVNGKIEIHTCDSGTAYNKWSKNCTHMEVSHCKTHATIPPRRTTTEKGPTTKSPSILYDICPFDNATLPDFFNCNAYYRCVNTTPTQEYCPENYGYSCWDQKCMPGAEVNCIMVGSQEGKKCSRDKQCLPNIQDCSKFYECQDGKAVSKKCDKPFQEYNKWYGECQFKAFAHCQIYSTVTPTSTTISITPSPIKDLCNHDGDVLPNPSNSSTYYKCVNHEPQIESCADGLIYSCWNETCVQPGDDNYIPGHQVGQKCNINGQKFNEGNCHIYYECVNNYVVSKPCKEGLFYNKWFHDCYPPHLAHCNNDSTITPPPTKRPNPTPPPQILHDICPIQGALLPNQFNCKSYYKCENNKPVSYDCPEGQGYSCWEQKCRPLSEAHCIADRIQVGLNCSQEGLKLQNVENCASNYVCKNGQVQIEGCSFGWEYNKWYMECVLFPYAHCAKSATLPPTTSVTPPPIILSPCTDNSIKLADVNNCKKYYKCKNGKYELQTCPDNLLWNYFSQKCTDSCFKPFCSKDPNIIHYPQSSKCLFGLKYPNPFTCDKYFVCNSFFNITEEKCPSGQKYDWLKMNCVTATTGQCAPTVEVNTTTTEISPGTTGGPPVPSNCTGVSKKLPDVNNCKNYYECKNGKYELQTCPDNLLWNYFSQKCKDSTFKPLCPKDPNVIHYPQSSKCLFGLKYPNPFTCDKYFVCNSFLNITEEQCPSGKKYDWLKMNCVTATTGQCAPTVEVNTTTTEIGPGTTGGPPVTSNCSRVSKKLPDVNNGKNYYECKNGKYELQTCPGNSLWNCITQLCGSSVYAPCCANDPNATHYKQFLRCGLFVNIKIPDPFKCNKYFECTFSGISQKTCSSGESFDWLKTSCVNAGTGKCVPTVEVNTTTTGIGGSPGTTVGPPVTSNCSRVSKKLPDVNNGKNYYECKNGKYELQTCPGNSLWNCITQLCGSSVYAPCCANDPNATHYKQFSRCGLFVNIKIPDPFKCDKYFECTFSGISQKTCPFGESFDWLKTRCGKTGKCIPTVPTTYEPGTATPALSTTTVMGEPTGGSSSTTEPAGQTTGKSTTGSSSTSSSTKSDSTSTSVKPTTKAPTTGTAGSSTTSSSTKLDSTSTSVEPTTKAPTTGTAGSTLKPSTLCPSTTELRYPAPDDCFGYFECQNRQLVKKKCVSGQNYNCRTKMCEPSTNPIHCCSTPTTTTTKLPIL